MGSIMDLMWEQYATPVDLVDPIVRIEEEFARNRERARAVQEWLDAGAEWI